VLSVMRLIVSAMPLCAMLAFVAPAGAAEAVPGTELKDCTECPAMIVIPGGDFKMGSQMEESGHPDEKPQHPVHIAKSFAVSKFEITFDQWDACTAAGGCEKASDDGLGRADRPVINVDWLGAKSYVAWLSKRTGKAYRLPAESEWEYAARAGTQTAWFWGAAEDSYGSRLACKFANLHDETGKKAHPNYVWSNHLCDDGFGETAPVGRYQSNPFGLYDMLGNVREWVEDCHGEYKDAPSDGSARTANPCEKRIVRGGAWIDGASTSRAAYRHPLPESHRNYQVGVRVARDL
jgi:formylglycine-generating enzyme required for sulfatase activity